MLKSRSRSDRRLQYPVTSRSPTTKVDYNQSTASHHLLQRLHPSFIEVPYLFPVGEGANQPPLAISVLCADPTQGRPGSLSLKMLSAWVTGKW